MVAIDQAVEVKGIQRQASGLSATFAIVGP
jgi:hypothetical protein